MKHSWDNIKNTIAKELKSTFISQQQSSYSFTFEEGLEVFCKTIIFKTGENDIDGIESKIIPTIDKYYHHSKDKSDSYNYLTQIATKLDTYLQKILFITDNPKYLRLKSQNKGMYHYVEACGINKNNIDFRNPISQIQDVLLNSNFGKQLYSAYNLRNIEAHTAIEHSDTEIPINFRNSLIIYLFATFENYNVLNRTVSTVDIPNEIEISEIARELTPPREYEISDEDIVGRESDIESLSSNIKNQDHIVLISGIGGIGKTTLLKGYLKKFKTNYNHIIWISYRENLINSFIQCVPLIENLQLNFPDIISDFEKFCIMQNRISKLPGNNILVLDNYSEDSSDNTSKLPFGNNWTILTSSRMELKSSKYYCIPTNKLNNTAAKQLFTKHYTGEVEEEALNELLELIEYHTLSIELLAKTLETNFTINGIPELLTHLIRYSISDEKWQVKLESNYSEYELNLRNHLLNAFKLSSLNKNEKRFLLYFSILPVELFSGSELIQIFQIPEDSISQFIDSLNSLHKKGWLKKVEGNFTSHAIIQEITKATIIPSEDNCKPVILGLSELLKIDDNVQISFKQRFIPSSLSVLKTIESSSEDICILCHFTSVVFKEIGSYNQASNLAEKALRIAEKLDAESLQWPIYSLIATINRKSGLLDEAFKNYKKSTDIINRTDRKDISMISVYINLGTLHEQMGNRENLMEAKSLYEFAIDELENFRRNIETNQYVEVHLAEAKGSLGKVFNLLGFNDKAIELQLYADSVFSTVLQKSNIPESINANNLGITFASINDFKNSFKYHQKAVKIQSEIFPEDHPELSVSLSGLASAYNNLGDKPKARELFEKVLNIGERTLNSDHPALARRKANLAAVLEIPKDLYRARKLYEEAIEIESKHYGRNNPSVANSIYNLGILHLEENNTLDALKKFTEALDIIYRNYGPNHEMTKLITWRIHSIS